MFVKTYGFFVTCLVKCGLFGPALLNSECVLQIFDGFSKRFNEEKKKKHQRQITGLRGIRFLLISGLPVRRLRGRRNITFYLSAIVNTYCFSKYLTIKLYNLKIVNKIEESSMLKPNECNPELVSTSEPPPK